MDSHSVDYYGVTSNKDLDGKLMELVFDEEIEKILGKRAIQLKYVDLASLGDVPNLDLPVIVANDMEHICFVDVASLCKPHEYGRMEWDLGNGQAALQPIYIAEEAVYVGKLFLYGPRSMDFFSTFELMLPETVEVLEKYLASRE